MKLDKRVAVAGKKKSTGNNSQKRHGGSEYDTTLLNHLMENIPDAIYFKDLESRFIAVSKALVQKHGFKNADQILGKTDFDFFSPESANEFFESEQELIRTGVPVINEEECEIWQDGTKTYALGTKMPLKDRNGKIIGTFGISRDITERKRAEEEITRINQELREVNLMKDKMLSVIAHDLKNPFAAILGLSNILVEDFDQLEPAEMRNFINTINDSTTHLYQLLEQLLTWLSARAGRIQVQQQTVRMYLVTDRVIKILTPQADAKNIRLHHTILADQIVSGDESMIETILRNLVGNAIKFTPNGGSVEIEMKDGPEYNRLTVRDTGVGINPGRLGSLFQEDKIQSSKGTMEEKGSGFGLLICKEFAEKMGGHIEVHSEAGKGSAFTIYLKRSGLNYAG
ncbi:MAG: PAS domain S-box protein [Alphaproteobacteria bacterium]|nr:PAS domain S-box protein [Alphaproteobacteria bacterium]